MRTTAYILFFLILTSCNSKLSNYYNSKAEKLEAEGKYKEAIVLLNKAIEKNPQNIYGLMNRGVDKSLLKDYKGAIEDYSRIIEIDEDNALAYLNRGKNKKRLKDYKGAIEDFDRAIKTKGGEFLYMDWSENSFVKNRFEFDVKMEEIRFERGFARYDIDSLRTSLTDFNFCIQKNFELSTSYYMVGLIHIAYGNTDKGCKMLIKSKELGDLDAQEMIDEYCKNNVMKE